jgi:hypothetical protein
MLTDEHIKNLSGLAVEKLTPFILHNLARFPVPPLAEPTGVEDDDEQP